MFLRWITSDEFAPRRGGCRWGILALTDKMSHGNHYDAALQESAKRRLTALSGM